MYIFVKTSKSFEKLLVIAIIFVKACQEGHFNKDDECVKDNKFAKDDEFAKDDQAKANSSIAGGFHRSNSVENYWTSSGGHYAKDKADLQGHYFVKAGQEGLFSKGNDQVASTSGASEKSCEGFSSHPLRGSSNKASYAQSVRFSEYVQKVTRMQGGRAPDKFLKAEKTQRGRVPEKLLPFAVYVEKFDISNSKVKLKLSDKEYLSIRTELINAFMLESQDAQVLLVNEYEKRVFNSERGIATFFTKSKLLRTSL